MLLLDTHVLVWLTEGNPRLGSNSLQQINRALVEEQLAVTSISFWEIAMLVEKQRLAIAMDLQVWRRDLLDHGIQEVFLHGRPALAAGSLENFHGDPADRMIVATALDLPATLVTADQKILDWPGLDTKIDARH